MHGVHPPRKENNSKISTCTCGPTSDICVQEWQFMLTFAFSLCQFALRFCVNYPGWKTIPPESYSCCLGEHVLNKNSQGKFRTVTHFTFSEQLKQVPTVLWEIMVSSLSRCFSGHSGILQKVTSSINFSTLNDFLRESSSLSGKWS